MLNRFRTFLLAGLVCVAQFMGQVVLGEQLSSKKSGDKMAPLFKWIPPGSKLTNVSLPRYKGKELASLLTSREFMVVSPRQISGKYVLVHLYEPGKGKTTSMWMLNASYFPDDGVVVSHGETRMCDARFDMVGSGMVYNTNLKKGLIKGPATTRFQTGESNKNKPE